MKKKRIVFAFAALTIFCSFVCGCGNPVIYSKRFDHEIDIDEKINELKDTLVHYYYDENTRVNIGIGSDDNFLYLCLLTRNHGLIEQLDNSGFTVWFDPKGKKNKTFGVRLFTGIQDADMQRDDLIPPDRNKAGRPSTTGSVVKKIEIIGPGKKERYVTSVETAKKYGITVATGNSDGYFVYGLKIPLVENEQHHYAIGISKNKIIGVGFESAGFGRGMPHGAGMPGGGGMGEGYGGMMRFGPGGGMGGSGRGPGGGGPGGRMGMPEGGEGLQLWLTVVLS